MSRFAITMAASLLLLAMGPAARGMDEDAAAKKDLDALQGVWTLVTQEEDGQKLPAEELKYTVLIVRGDKFTHTNGKNTITGTFRLVGASASPKTLDSIPNGGPFKGQAIPGIYEVNNGRFKLCLGVPGKPRPKEFTAEAGTGNELTVCRHHLPEKAAGSARSRGLFDDLVKKARKGGGHLSDLTHQALDDARRDGKNFREDVQRAGKEFREDVQREGKEAREELQRKGKNLREEVQRDGKNLREEIQREGKNAREEVQRKGKNAREEIQREGKNAREEVQREGKNAREKAQREGKNAREELQREGKTAREDLQRKGKNAQTGAAEEVWAESFRRGYPAGAAIQEKRYPFARALPEPLKAALRASKLYPEIDLDRIRVHWSALPFNSWNVGGREKVLAGKQADAQTFGYQIYVRDPDASPLDFSRVSVLVHELVHVKQYLRHKSSLEDFGYEYGKDYKRANEVYEDNPMEKEAFDFEDAHAQDVYDAYTRLLASVPKPSSSVKRIGVSFTNRTTAVVQFHLNGGKGLDTSLKPGHHASFSMVLDSGVTPTVAIVQAEGKPLAFSVSDGGVYEFRQDGKRIKNFYAEKR